MLGLITAAAIIWFIGVIVSAYLGGRFFPKQTDFLYREILFILWPVAVVVSPLFLVLWIIGACWESGKRDREGATA